MARRIRKIGPFHLGDRVRLRYGWGRPTGEVIEAFGGIGANGRHLYRVQVPTEFTEPMIIELGEDDIDLVEAAGEERATS